jgi:hypothetical protein
MAKSSFNSCCIGKIKKYIYEQNNNNYNFVECCNLIYYLLPYKIDSKTIFFIRESSKQDYYFLTKDLNLIKVFTIEDSKDERKEKIKNTILNNLK